MLYVSSMAGYDQRLLEDGKTNRFLPRENASHCFFAVVFFDNSRTRPHRAQHLVYDGLILSFLCVAGLAYQCKLTGKGGWVGAK